MGHTHTWQYYTIYTHLPTHVKFLIVIMLIYNRALYAAFQLIQ